MPLLDLGRQETSLTTEDLDLKVVARVCQQVALVHPNDVVLGNVQPHLLVESVYITQNPK